MEIMIEFFIDNRFTFLIGNTWEIQIKFVVDGPKVVIGYLNNFI